MNPPASNPNRALLLTPPGIAAIAVVRCLGPSAKSFVQSHFSRPLHPGKPIHGHLRDSTGTEIDDPLIFLSPEESFVDLHLHAGSWVVRSVLELARKSGFHIVENLPMPLPNEAIDSTDIIQREIDAFLPLAATDLALRTLLSQSSAWKSLLDIVAADASPRTSQLIDQTLSDPSLHWLLHLPRVAIIGLPNAGKSTLANQLFSQNRSITADLPGTTRDFVAEPANLDGLPIHLIDTPGIRQTPDEIERQSIARSAQIIQQADLIVLVLDASQFPSDDESTLLQHYPSALIVLNKIDLASPSRLRLRESSPAPLQTIATTGFGIDAVRSAIRRHFQCENLNPILPRCWTDRQRNDLRRPRTV